jgi:hypothetical protein
MKLFKMLTKTLFVAGLSLLAAPGISAEPAHLLPAASIGSLSIFIALALICLVIGLGLRAFSKPPSDLSLNQRTKKRI